MERAYRRPETLEGREPPGRSSHSTESSSGEPERRPGAAGSPLNAARGALREVFGFEGFRLGQEAVIEALLHGRHALTREVLKMHRGTPRAEGRARHRWAMAEEGCD